MASRQRFLRFQVLAEALLAVRNHFSSLHSAAVIANKGHPNVLDWVTRWGLSMGTSQERKGLREEGVALQYAWERKRADQAQGAMVTLWTEDLDVDPDGTWFALDWLNPDLHQTGQPRGPLQAERTRERARILKAAFDEGRPFIGLLLENRLTKDELFKEASPQSVIFNSVRDDQNWWVVKWDEKNALALLARGTLVSKDWRPAAERPKENGPVGLMFPDQLHRDAVEEAAIAAVTKEWSRYQVTSHESKNLGYDLELRSRATDKVEYLFEVKGTAGEVRHFFITQNEVACAGREKQWRLVIVTSALNGPVVHEPLRWDEVKQEFDIEPLAWHASLRQSP